MCEDFVLMLMEATLAYKEIFSFILIKTLWESNPDYFTITQLSQQLTGQVVNAKFTYKMPKSEVNRSNHGCQIHVKKQKQTLCVMSDLMHQHDIDIGYLISQIFQIWTQIHISSKISLA